MKDRGKRRKLGFHKALRKFKLCQSIFGDADYYNDGILGKYKDGKIHDHEDYKKTNSEWFGKRNFKHSDKLRDISLSEREDDYNNETEE